MWLCQHLGVEQAAMGWKTEVEGRSGADTGAGRAQRPAQANAG